jgi:Ca-activated chloride channel family protein
MQCPLTTDYDAFMMFLDAIDVDTVSAGTTALDQAIKKAMEAFGQMKERKNKLLVIFTDGEDFSSNLALVKREALAQGMHIFTVGVGTPEGAPIPVYDVYGNQVGHQKDDKGTIVITRLNEGILRSVAQDSGSIYVSVTADDSDIRSLVRAVNSFEKEKLEDKKIATMNDQYHYFLLISFICLVLEWIV